MKATAFIIIIVITMFILSFTESYNKVEIKKTLEGNSRDSIIRAIKMVVKHKDTSMIQYLLINAHDPRISHKRSSLGKSIYYLRMDAIKSITGIAPTPEISHKPDSLVIKFYTKQFSK